MRPGTKIFPYNVEAGDQRGNVSCLLTHSIPGVTVDLIYISRFQSQDFSPECLWPEGDIMLSIVLKAEKGELGRVSSPARWPSPYLLKSQDKGKLFVAKPLPQTLWDEGGVIRRCKHVVHRKAAASPPHQGSCDTLPTGGASQCLLFSRLIGFWAPWDCADQCWFRWIKTERFQNSFFSQTLSSLNTGDFFKLRKRNKAPLPLYPRVDWKLIFCFRH